MEFSFLIEKKESILNLDYFVLIAHDSSAHY